MPDLSKVERSKLRWSCHRGMKELDVVLSGYLEDYYPKANKEEQQAFKELLQLEDPVLYSLLLENNNSDNSLQSNILKTLRTQD